MGEAIIPATLILDFDTSKNTIALSTAIALFIIAQGDKDKTILQNTSGVFPTDLIADLMQFMNSCVLNQTIIPYTHTTALLLTTDASTDANKKNQGQEIKITSSSDPAHLLAM